MLRKWDAHNFTQFNIQSILAAARSLPLLLFLAWMGYRIYYHSCIDGCGPYHNTTSVADLDGDGDLDVVLAGLREVRSRAGLIYGHQSNAPRRKLDYNLTREQHMLEILDESNGNTVGLRLSDGVNEDDFISLLPRLQDILEAYGFANLLIEISDVVRWGGYASGSREADAVRMSDITLGRVAIVGDKSWQAWLVKFLDPFTSSEERFFYPDQRQEAWGWVRSGRLTPE